MALCEVDLDLGALVPGQHHHPVEVGARDRVLGGGGRHLGQALELAHGLLLDVLRHARLLDLLLELVVLALLVVAVAQLLLDRLHLLAQVVLALVLLELGLHLVLDLAADLEHLEVLDQDLVDAVEADAHVEGLQELLALRGVERGQAAGDEVGESRRLLDVAGQGRELVGEGGGELDHALEEAERALGERLRSRSPGRTGTISPMSSMRALTNGPVLRDLEDAEALHALDDQPQRPVGKLEHLADVGERADAVEVALDRVVDRGVTLGDHPDDPPLAHRLVHERHGALPGHRQRQDRMREQDGVAQRQEASSFGRFSGVSSGPPPDSKSGVGSSLVSLISPFRL